MEIKIAHLQERVEALHEQMKRLISHIESEQRVSINHEKRIDANERDVSWIKESVKGIESSLKTLVLDVHSLKQKSGVWKDVILIASVLANIVQVFIYRT